MPELDIQSIGRIGEVVRRVELTTRNDPGRGAGPRIQTPSRLAITTSAIGAGNPSTKQLGYGTVKFQLISPASNSTSFPYADLLDSGGNTVSVTVLNGGPSIASGRLVQLKIIDGCFLVDVDYCDSSSSGSSSPTSPTPRTYVNSNKVITSADAGVRQILDASAGGISITLPDMASWAGPDISFFYAGPSGMATIVPAGSDMIIDPSTNTTTSSYSFYGFGNSFSLAPIVCPSGSTGGNGWGVFDA